MRRRTTPTSRKFRQRGPQSATRRAKLTGGVSGCAATGERGEGPALLDPCFEPHRVTTSPPHRSAGYPPPYSPGFVVAPQPSGQARGRPVLTDRLFLSSHIASDSWQSGLHAPAPTYAVIF